MKNLTIKQYKNAKGYYYRVVGTKDGVDYLLGYTSNKWAWIRNANGWKKSELLFIKIYK